MIQSICRSFAGIVCGLLVARCSTALADVPPNDLTAAEQRGQWKLLFDGATTEGWRNYRKQDLSDGWQVKDGALVRVGKEAGSIVSVDEFKYFELSIDYKIEPGGNSGIMFHVTEDSADPGFSGPEVQILDNAKGRDPQKAGWLYQLYKPQKPDWARDVEKQARLKTPEVDDATRPAGEWNQVYLRVAANQCEVAVNGVSYYYFVLGNDDWNERVAKSKFVKYPQFGKAGKGRIALQDHGDEIAFRNIKIRELADDGSVPDPSDGRLPLKGVAAFPDLEWEGWEPVTEAGKIKPLRPIVLTHAGDASDRAFVASQIGTIHVFPNDPAAKEAKLFLDLRSKVHDWEKDNEEGLLGLAFHPLYKSNGEFFVYYSSHAELRVSIVSRFRVSKDDPDRADPDSEEVVMKIPQPFANHNGGSIVFGHDGYLYIGLGDGGSRNDPLRHGQNLETWLGSILRIDVDQNQNGQGYGIPADNPFQDRPDARPETYAYGFRNVWRLSVDRETGALWAGDVGQDLWEEIDIVERGGNYGWSLREGTHPFGNNPATPQDEPIEPVWEYDHQVGKSITGGIIYRGTKVPELQGLYLYADFVTGKIWALDYDAAVGKVNKNWQIASGGIPVLSFGEDEAGEVYYLIESADGRGIQRFETSK